MVLLMAVKNKKRKELIYLRAMLCIIIIITHTLTQYMRGIDGDDLRQLKVIYYAQNIFIFGTPCFIILSQLLTTLNYASLRITYLTSRFKYIILPYLCVGCFYCYSESRKLGDPFWHQFWQNVVLGYWYGYFILIIIQYFILSYLIYKITPKIFNSKLLLIGSFFVQYFFLYYLHHNHQFETFVHKIYPLSDNTFILGWIFFFFLGGYIGYNYHKIIAFLHDFPFIILTLAVGSYLMFVFLFGKHDYWNVTSYSESLMLYHMSMFLLLLSLCIHYKYFMFGVINLINSFSFFIYLLHPIVLEYVYEYTSIFINTSIIFIIFSVVETLGICIGIGIILREFYICRFIIGKQPYKLDIDFKGTY